MERGTAPSIGRAAVRELPTPEQVAALHDGSLDLGLLRDPIDEASLSGVNDVPGSAELSGEREAPGRQSLCTMEEQQLGHVARP